MPLSAYAGDHGLGRGGMRDSGGNDCGDESAMLRRIPPQKMEVPRALPVGLHFTERGEGMRRSAFFLHLGWLVIIVIAMPSLFLFLSLPPAHGINFYKWVDKNGAVNFSDDPEKVPPQYRDQVEREVGEDTSSAEPPTTVQSPSQGSEEVRAARKDIHGMGETWWRDKARPWNQQLKDATANLEAVNNKIVERTKTVTQKYSSPTQVNLYNAGLETLKGERAKYQAQVDEAKEMLRKLAKEAEDAKADPDWLK